MCNIIAYYNRFFIYKIKVIYICNAKGTFQQPIEPIFNLTLSFRNCNMRIWCSKSFLIIINVENSCANIFFGN